MEKLKKKSEVSTVYEMIFKRKSFHLFRGMGNERLTDADLQDIRSVYQKLDTLYPDIKTDIRIVPSNERFLGRGAEYAIEILQLKYIVRKRGIT